MTKDELVELSKDTFYDNDYGGITASSHREFNKELIDSVAMEKDFTRNGDGTGFLSDDGSYKEVAECAIWHNAKLSGPVNISSNNLKWRIFNDVIEIVGDFTSGSSQAGIGNPAFLINNIPERYVLRMISGRHIYTRATGTMSLTLTQSYLTVDKLGAVDINSGEVSYSFCLNFSSSVQQDTTVFLSLTVPLAAVRLEDVVMGLGSSLRKIAYGNGRFVAVGDSGSAAISTDGINWEHVDMNTTNWLGGICYGDGKFVAYGAQYSSYVSEDGVNWISGSMENEYNASYSDITYGGGKFVAVGQFCTVASEDGINWVPGYLGTSDVHCGIAYGNGTFVFVGDDGNCATSTDGITWEVQHLGTAFYGLVYEKGLFVATGHGRCGVSADGINWEFGNITVADPEFFYSVTYGNGMFLAVGDRGSYAVSDDGLTWTIGTMSRIFQHVTYGKGMFVTVWEDAVCLFRR